MLYMKKTLKMCINFKYTYIAEKSFRRANVLRRIGPSQAQTIHAVFSLIFL